MSIFRNAEILYASPQAIKGIARETSCLSRKHQEMDRNDAAFVDMAGSHVGKYDPVPPFSCGKIGKSFSPAETPIVVPLHSTSSGNLNFGGCVSPHSSMPRPGQ